MVPISENNALKELIGIVCPLQEAQFLGDQVGPNKRISVRYPSMFYLI